MFKGILRRFVTPTLIPDASSGLGTCDLLIPVYNRPDTVRNLLASLAATTNRSLLRRIWIGDDCSDAFTSQALDRLAHESGLPITVVHRKNNVGFVENCQDLFMKSDAQHCVIFHTDIRVPPFWLERMLAPFAHDPMITHAIPFTTDDNNRPVRLLPGQHWMEADRLLAAIEPTFPDSGTTCGCCMAVHAERVREKNIPLFDPSFDRGDGKDAYRHPGIVTRELRSVFVDNLLVHHGSQASISVPPIHDPSLPPFLPPTTAKHLEILFVIPTANMRYGGIWFIVEIAQALTAAGVKVGIFVLDDSHASLSAHSGFSAFHHAENLTSDVASISCVVSTAQNTIRPAQEFVRHYRAVDLLFLQSMEVVFRTGHNIDTFQQFARAPNVITVSECLVEYILIINPAVNVRRIRIGPDPLIFYPREVTRRPRTVAVASNMIPEKGMTQALEIALMLRSRGFHLTLFGWDTAYFLSQSKIGDVHTDTSRQGLAELFSRTEFIIDQSHLEGLGLLALEAAFCGCIPIVGSRGAAEYFFKDGENSITINGYKNLAESLSRVDTLSRDEKDRLRRNAMTLRSERNLELGLEDAVKEFSAFAGLTKKSPHSSLREYAVLRA